MSRRFPALKDPLRICFLFLSVGLVAPASHSENKKPKTGVIVEKVAKTLEAERAGIAEGDTLLRWFRGDAKGEIVSPFDISRIEIEEAPRGRVTFEGIRNNEERTWQLGSADWGLTTRPDLPPVLLSAYSQGQDLASRGKPRQAASRWRAAASDRSHPAWLRVWFLLHAAETLTDARQLKEADGFYEEAFQEAPEMRAQLLQKRADAFQQGNNWDSAEKYYREALRVEKPFGKNFHIALILDSLGSVALARGDLAKSEEYFGQALSIQQTLAPKGLGVASSLTGLGKVFGIRGNLVKAEEYGRRALTIREELAPGSVSIANTLNLLGTATYWSGDLVNAKEYYQRALTIGESVAPFSIEVAVSLEGLGFTAWSHDDSEKAEEYFHNALSVTRDVAPGSIYLGTCLAQLGFVALSHHDLIRADQYYRQAQAIYQKLAPNGPYAVDNFMSLGVIAGQRYDLASSHRYFQRALLLQQKLAPYSPIKAWILVDLGWVAQLRGDLTKAEGYYRRAVSMSEKQQFEKSILGKSLNGLGAVAERQGNLATAEEYDREALATLKEPSFENSLLQAYILSDLGDVVRERGDRSKAEEYYRQALAIRERLEYGSVEHAETLVALASIQRNKGQLDVATGLYEQALNALENQLVHLGGTEELRSSFRAKHANYYWDCMDLLIAQNKLELAFHMLERSRARSMLTVLTEAHINFQKGIDPPLVERERFLRRLLDTKTDRRIRLLRGKHTEEQSAAVDKELRELVAEYGEVEEQIRESNPNYAALTQPRTLSVEEIQKQLLDADTLLLEYALGEERSYVWVVSPDLLEAHQLPKRAEIELATRRVYDLLTARNLHIRGETALQWQTRVAKAEAEYPQAAAELSRMVLGPVSSLLKQKRLLIVSDGALHYIPFMALPTPAASPGVTTPLMVDHEIVNLPSASVLAALRREEIGRKEAPKAVAVLADPVFDKEDPRLGRRTRGTGQSNHTSRGRERNVVDVLSADLLVRSELAMGLAIDGQLHLSRLPFTRREAKAILAVTPPGQAMEALDFGARRRVAISPELAQYRIVHFATHGVLDSERPELSGLVFSMVDERGRPVNGYLSLQDIYNLNLPADLVVLSACETGLGKEVRGEGLIGLTRGFMYAGAARVAATLWKIDDVATAELMGRFYEAMEKEGMRPAAALRQAQIDVWKQKRWGSPYYWAAFQMHGEWR